MQWFTRLILGLPPRAQDINELREAAPELFSEGAAKSDLRHYRLYIHPAWVDSGDLMEAVKEWIKEFEGLPQEHGEEEPCEHPFCYRKRQSMTDTESSHVVMEMMVVAGGKEFNPPAKSFFDLINTTKKKHSTVRRVIMTDPFIYSDIGETGSGGGFTNLIALLKHLNIHREDVFELQLTPRGNGERKKDLQERIKSEFLNCTLVNHKESSVFHDRFILVEYKDADKRAWYGPSLNGLNSDSIVIFGDITETNAMKQLSQRLLGLT